jgi:hypothetical protein
LKDFKIQNKKGKWGSCPLFLAYRIHARQALPARFATSVLSAILAVFGNIFVQHFSQELTKAKREGAKVPHSITEPFFSFYYFSLYVCKRPCANTQDP